MTSAIEYLFDVVVMRLQWDQVLKHFEPAWPGKTRQEPSKDRNGQPAWYDPETMCKPWTSFIARPAWAIQVPATLLNSFEVYLPIRYVGSVPFTQSTPGSRDPRRLPPGRRLPHNNQAQIRQKSISIRQATSHYVPTETLRTFLFEYWQAHYADHPTATDQVLGNILEQFTLCRPGQSASNTMVRRYIEMAKKERSRRFSSSGESSQELARTALILSKTRWSAPHDYIKVVTAIGLYQSAVVSYLDHLEAAVRRNPMPDDDDEFTALHVIREGLNALRESVVFATVLPLVIINHQEQTPSDFTPEAMCQAIGRAWEDLFGANLLRTEMGDARMVCAGNQHLRFLKDTRIIEQLYCFVDDNQRDPQLARLQAELAYAGQQALRYRSYYYRYFLKGGSKPEATAALRARMAHGL